MSVPGEFTAGDVLAASEMNALPGGKLGYAEVTANQTGITTEVDLTGLSVTVTVPAGRRVKITGQVSVSSSAASDWVVLNTSESTTVLQSARMNIPSVSPTREETLLGMVVIAPSSGSHTYKLSMRREAGTGTLVMAATVNRPAFILVEDIGPV